MHFKRFFTSLPRSFYSPQLYQEVAREWHGIGALRLLTVALIYTLMQTGQSIISISETTINAKHVFGPYLRQIPDFDIREGRLTVNEPMPLAIIEPSSGKELIVIDTTGETTSLEDHSAAILLTESRIYFKDNPITFGMWIYDGYQGSGQYILDNMRKWVVATTISVSLLCFTISAFCMAMIACFCTLTGVILSEIFSVKLLDLKLAAMLRVAVVASAPSWLLLATLSVLSGFTLSLGPAATLHFTTGVLYFAFGIFAQANKPTPSNH